ncbi:tetratricopeptide repeat protein [Anaerolineales bacterium HSG24]|nr:tetratricopeptide repeat protein [Anaerolineales bacterium HSG24]
MNSPAKTLSYLPIDRRVEKTLPRGTWGTALFADVSGFTPLTELLIQQYDIRRGNDLLTVQLNEVYGVLVEQVHCYRGSVLTFAGDAITCWFEQDDGLRATACGLAMQSAMQRFASLEPPLALKVAVASGNANRFLVGDPKIQLLDVLVGDTLNRMAKAEKFAASGEVLLSPEVAVYLNGSLDIAEQRGKESQYLKGARYAVVRSINHQPEVEPWPLTATSVPESEVQPWVLPPVYQQYQEDRADELDTLQPVAVLFFSFTGLDYDRDPDASTKLNDFIQQTQRTLQSYRSYIKQLIFGDKGSYFYVMFGAPLPLDDAGKQAIDAAIALQHVADQFDYINTVKIGIDYGRTRTGRYGGKNRLTYGGLGDTVNTAARLMSKAKPGEIMVSQSIYDYGHKKYRFDHVGAVQLKGKVGHHEIYRVIDALQLDIFSQFTEPLWGRGSQISRIDRSLGVIWAEKEQVFCIEGVKGIGKSHLANEFVKRAYRRGVRVIQGSCDPSIQNVMYHPWRAIFRALLDLPATPEITATYRMTADQIRQVNQQQLEKQIVHLEQKIKGIGRRYLVRLPVLGDLLNLNIPDNATTANFSPEVRQNSLFDLAEKIIQHATISPETYQFENPIVILLEDTHWLDEASWQLLASLTRRQKDLGVMYLLVQRPITGKSVTKLFEGISNYSHLHLGELSAEGVYQYAKHLLGDEISTLVVNLIQSKTQGVPFFVQEFTKSLQSGDFIYLHPVKNEWHIVPHLFNQLKANNHILKQGGSWVADDLTKIDLGIPETMHEVVLNRLKGLPPTSFNLLKFASLIGRKFEFDVLAHAHPERLQTDEIRLMMADLQEQDFIQPDPLTPSRAFIFRHNITQQVAYETMLGDKERQYHRLIAESLEVVKPDEVERLAHHFYEAKIADKAVYHLERAALKAKIEYANETALDFYTKALEFGEVAQLRLGQIEILHLLGLRDRQRAALETLADTPDVTNLGQHKLWFELYFAIAEYDEAEKAGKAALSVAETITEQAASWLNLALLATKQGNYNLAEERYNEAIGLLDLKTITTETKRHIVIEIFHGLSTVKRQQGDFQGATTYAEDALAMSGELEDKQNQAVAYYKLGDIASYQRHHQVAVAYYQQALTIQQLTGDRVGEGKILNDLSGTTRNQGHYHQAQIYSNQALEILQATNNRWEEVNVWIDLGIMFQELGVFSEAEDCLRSGIKLAQDIGDEVGVAYLLVNWGLVELDQGDYAKAEQLLLEGMVIVKTAGDKSLMTYFHNYLSMVYVEIGDCDKAIEQANKSMTLHHTLDMKWSTTDNFAVLAKAYLTQGDTNKAVEYANQAWELLEECKGEGPEFPQRDYCACGDVFAHVGDSRAEQAYSLARNFIETRAEHIQDDDLREAYLQVNNKYMKNETRM